ncbi:Uncharacterized protein TPAR_01046 [Tolypocladium paradoxum]|uniref:Uncharacterized protein n=1 Tax=Tolypocladium paradoxum TaxID=94208 RepID=A0A2S4L8I1_9HYPO|nr:Uncharacterized protein TPAR_01046 [Tolypocladium paradoxum]
MKYAIIFASTAVLAYALPRGTPTGQKLPWQEPSQFSFECGFKGIDEKTCGTEAYCQRFDEYNESPVGHDGQFKTTKQCFDAHEHQPLDPDRMYFPED